MVSDKDVLLAALGIIATAVGVIGFVAKYALQELARDLREHTRAAIDSARASRESVAASREMLIFMKKLNGKLENAVIKKSKR